MSIPKEDGYYWYKPKNDKSTIVEVEDANKTYARFYFIANEQFLITDEMTGEFLSKITPSKIV